MLSQSLITTLMKLHHAIETAKDELEIGYQNEGSEDDTHRRLLDSARNAFPPELDEG